MLAERKLLKNDALALRRAAPQEVKAARQEAHRGAWKALPVCRNPKWSLSCYLVHIRDHEHSVLAKGTFHMIYTFGTSCRESAGPEQQQGAALPQTGLADLFTLVFSLGLC